VRTTTFGGTVIERLEDDLGAVEVLEEAGKKNVYAVVRKDEYGSDNLFYFEVMRNDDGEVLVSSDPVFRDKSTIRRYLHDFVSEVQFD